MTTSITRCRADLRRQNAERAERYALFAKTLGLRELPYSRTAKIESLLNRSCGFDHDRYWAPKGDRKTVIVVNQPYDHGTGSGKRSRDHLRLLGFEAEIVPNFVLHHPSATLVMGVLGRPGLLSDLIELVEQINDLQKEAVHQ